MGLFYKIRKVYLMPQLGPLTTFLFLRDGRIDVEKKEREREWEPVK